VTEQELLRQALLGDAQGFDELTKPYRKRLHLHCYRMLGSPFDADDALQETLLAAWRGLGAFESRSAVGTWLTAIATRVCLRIISGRRRRLTSADYGPPLTSTAELGDPVPGRSWVESIPDGELPYKTADEDDPASIVLRREDVRLAFIAVLQHLPGTQRAVLLMRDVLGYSAAETAEMLDTSVASVNSALQRARNTLAAKSIPDLRSAPVQLMDRRQLDVLLKNFVSAWERRDIDAMVEMLASDARFTMPPLPAWFSGREAVARFFAERVFATPWRLQPLRGNSQPGFACYQQQAGDDPFRPGGVVLLSVEEGKIAAIDSFLDSAVCRRFGMLEEMN
jgi:RNA polymerase sigma-70 factor (ECF subfamily)